MLNRMQKFLQNLPKREVMSVLGRKRNIRLSVLKRLLTTVHLNDDKEVEDEDFSEEQMRSISRPLTTVHLNDDKEVEDEDFSEEKTQDKEFYPTTPLITGSSWYGDDSDIKVLNERGRDLTYEAFQGKLLPAYGRDKEIQQIVEILQRRVKRNPLLVGEAGVGKTAIVESLALAIVNRRAPELLKNKKIIAISLFDIIAQGQGANFAEYAERLRHVVNALRTQPDEFTDQKGRIAFFDEIHTIIGYEHGSSYLKQYLARGEIQIIGATTLDEYRRYIERDPALERRFAPIMIEEPNQKDTIEILKKMSISLGTFYNVKVSDSAIKLVVELSHRYIYDRRQPDKSIELLERTCVRVANLASDNQSSSNMEVQSSSMAFLGEGPTANNLLPSVEEKHVRTIVAEWTGIPDSSLNSERQKYVELENELKRHVVGQNEAIREVARIILANKAGTVVKPQRPNGVFLFVGPTGVGKTELAKAISILLTGKEEHLVVLDMTGYRESYTIASLVGIARGNNDTPEIPTLTKLVRDHPFGVLLLDEIEKAHPELWSLFMPVFEEGELVDRQGSTIHFSDMVIVMTANVDVRSRTNAQFERKKDKPQSELEKGKLWKDIYKDQISLAIQNELQFPREFLNRIDKTIVFYPLAKTNVESIVNMQLNQLGKRLGIRFDLTPQALNFLTGISNKSEYGAREVRRAIDTQIGAQIGVMMLQAEIDAWEDISVVKVDINSGQDGLRVEPSRL